MLERTSTSVRYARGIAAAIVAVATLVLAANAGPARAAESDQEPRATALMKAE
ncbi:putative secreted protein [Streptomyces davaonensis JCM 4913]|uniref:Putative secreted protein n=1 Tax=Streptomyces davaonensis (strain DSM 101723 / JCM 4913 / KCC S-0913 / 768) TaxID=1214101 RepID=K4R7P9_STRDJ|nr:putative secreted protein [Streptomyces davaonensis JCM 4913]